MLDETFPVKLDQMRLEIAALAQAVGGLQSEVHLLAEITRRLVTILTPEQKDGGGQQLAMALAQLVQSVEQQNRMLENLSGVLVTFVREMPTQITQAVMEATSGFLTVMRDLPGKVRDAMR